MIPFELWAAIIAGLVAGAAMEGPAYLQKALGLPLKQDIFRTWGQNLLRVRGAAGYVAGFAFHEAVAALAAVLYAASFDLVGVDSHLLLWGLLGGVVHWLIAGPIIAVIPSTDPDTGATRGHGYAYRGYGRRDVATSLVGHLGFGAAVAVVYALLHGEVATDLLL